MRVLHLLVFSALALLCSAVANPSPQFCLATYSDSNGDSHPCGLVSVSWMKGLAKNCTGDDLAGAYAALTEYCENSQRQNEHAGMQQRLESAAWDKDTRVIMRRRPSGTATSEDSKIEPQQWQSSSSSSRHQSWAWKSPSPGGLSFSAIFAERSVRFALSGLLLTTLTSFIFL